jgi:hypothetical protein
MERIVQVPVPILIAPPESMMTLCSPERVKEDSVKALARGYIVNTREAWKCNDKLEALHEWVLEQRKLYDGTNK